MFEPLNKITKEKIYEKLSDLLSKEQFEKMIGEMRKEHHNLLNDDALAFILLDKLGRNDFAKRSISALRDGESVTMVVEIEELVGERFVRARDGKEKEIVEVRVKDESGGCMLTVWSQENMEVLREADLKKGDKIKIINGRFKRGSFGNQINIGSWSKIEIIKT